MAPNFKISGVEQYDGHVNPKQWVTSYATIVWAGGGNTDVMANYFPIMLKPTTINWLTSLQSDIIDSRDDLKRLFIENYKATC